MTRIPAEQRSHPEVLDRHSGESVGLEVFLAGMDRENFIEKVRVDPCAQLADGTGKARAESLTANQR